MLRAYHASFGESLSHERLFKITATQVTSTTHWKTWMKL